MTRKLSFVLVVFTIVYNALNKSVMEALIMCLHHHAGTHPGINSSQYRLQGYKRLGKVWNTFPQVINCFDWIPSFGPLTAHPCTTSLACARKTVFKIFGLHQSISTYRAGFFSVQLFAEAYVKT